MFHLYGLPFKLSYLAIGFIFVDAALYHPNILRGPNRDVLVLFWVLAVMTCVGSVVFLIFYGGVSYANSVRNIIVFLMAPMAFIAGSRDPRLKHNYIIFLIFGYAIFTLGFSVYYQQLGWIVSLYGLQEQIATGVYSARSQGLFFNANISALFMTILYIYFIGGVRHGFIKAGVPTILAVIIAVFGTIVVLGSRNEFIAASLLTLLLVLPMLASRRHRATAISVTVFMGLLVIFSSQLGNIAGNYLEYNPTKAIRHTFSLIGDTSQPVNSFLRPIRNLKPALTRWSASPLVGTGFDFSEGDRFTVTAYHNDWLSVLAASGFLGLLVLAVIVYRLARLDLILVIPFLLPAMTNSFVFAPSHLLLFMLLAGMIYRRRRNHRPVETEAVVAASDLPVGRQHSYAG
jgi:hypothetical protein